jgi:hypothetical protein
MQPNVLDAAGWAMIGGVITKLTVFTVLMILSAFAMLLARAVLPSLIGTHQIATPYTGYRRVLSAVGLIGFALAIVQFVRIVVDVVAILTPFFPRFGF